VASVSRCQKLPLCLIEPVPSSSKTDLLLVKAETIKDGGSASMTAYLRRWKKFAAQRQLQPGRGVRICERNNSAHIKVGEEGGEGGAPGARAEIPLQPKTMVTQVVSPQPMEVHSGADIHSLPLEDSMPEQVNEP